MEKVKKFIAIFSIVFTVVYGAICFVNNKLLKRLYILLIFHGWKALLYEIKEYFIEYC